MEKSTNRSKSSVSNHSAKHQRYNINLRRFHFHCTSLEVLGKEFNSKERTHIGASIVQLDTSSLHPSFSKIKKIFLDLYVTGIATF